MIGADRAARSAAAAASGQEQTLTEFLIAEQRKVPGATGNFTALVNDLRLACKRIGNVVGKGALTDAVGKAGTTNVQGEEQANLDVLANRIFIRTFERNGTLAGMVSEELEDVCRIPPEYPRGHYLLAFDPLDGSSNIDVNVSVGSIFAVLGAGSDPLRRRVPGRQQWAARPGLQYALGRLARRGGASDPPSGRGVPLPTRRPHHRPEREAAAPVRGQPHRLPDRAGGRSSQHR